MPSYVSNELAVFDGGQNKHGSQGQEVEPAPQIDEYQGKGTNCKRDYGSLFHMGSDYFGKLALSDWFNLED